MASRHCIVSSGHCVVASRNCVMVGRNCITACRHCIVASGHFVVASWHCVVASRLLRSATLHFCCGEFINKNNVNSVAQKTVTRVIIHEFKKKTFIIFNQNTI